MKDNIDVFQQQVQRDRSRNRVPPVDYKEHDDTFHVIQYIFECGIKLNANPLTLSTAAVLYHKFFKEAESTNYDKFMIASTCLYLAGKIKDEQIKVRDIINVSRNTLHRNTLPLDLKEEYWSMRDAIVQGELLVMRMLKFEVTITHPHKYMLHYLKTLQTWISPDEWKKVPIVHMAYSFLQDFHFVPTVLDYKAQHVAIACINLSLQVHGIQVPYTDEDEGITWYSPNRLLIKEIMSRKELKSLNGKLVKGIHSYSPLKEEEVFVDDLTKDLLWELMENLMEVYDKGAESNIV